MNRDIDLLFYCICADARYLRQSLSVAEVHDKHKMTKQMIMEKCIEFLDIPSLDGLLKINYEILYRYVIGHFLLRKRSFFPLKQ